MVISVRLLKAYGYRCRHHRKAGWGRQLFNNALELLFSTHSLDLPVALHKTLNTEKHCPNQINSIACRREAHG